MEEKETSNKGNAILAAKQIAEINHKDILQILKLQQGFDATEDCLTFKKAQFTKLKHGLLDLTARMVFLKNLKEDPSCWPTPADADKHLEDLELKLGVAKEENSAFKENIDNLCEKGEEALVKFQTNSAELDNKIDELEKAITQLEEAKEKTRNRVTQSREQLESKKAKLSYLEKIISKTREELEKKKVVIRNLKRQNKLKSEVVANQRDSIEKHWQPLMTRHENAVKFLSQMNVPQLKIHCSDHSKLIVEFQGKHPLEENCPSLFINLQLKQTVDGSVIISDANVNQTTFSILDILETEQECIPAFVRKVIDRWQSHHP